jgi:spore coat protein U-like protein
MIRTLKLAVLAAVAVLLVRPAPASAATIVTMPNALHVTTTVAAACTITAGTLDFGSIDVTPAPMAAKTASGSITVACTKNAPATKYQIYLKSPTNNWNLKNAAGEALPYSLTDGSNNPWNQTTPVNYTASSKAPQVITVKGTIAGGNYDVSVGTYTDDVTAQIDL